jgi:hypothetical protein
MNDLVLSSCVFITNAFTAFYKKYYLYSALFVLLTVSSVIFHSFKDLYTYIFDLIVVCTIILYGGYLFHLKSTAHNYNYQIISVTMILVVIYLFICGYIIQDYCYNIDQTISNHYHSLVHILSSIGLHFVIFL